LTRDLLKFTPILNVKSICVRACLVVHVFGLCVARVYLMSMNSPLIFVIIALCSTNVSIVVFMVFNYPCM